MKNPPQQESYSGRRGYSAAEEPSFFGPGFTPNSKFDYGRYARGEAPFNPPDPPPRKRKHYFNLTLHYS